MSALPANVRRPVIKKPERKTQVLWKAQAGSQALFLSCPYWEILYEGTRGPGKTDALLMKFAKYVGKGYGENWRGVIFRREYKHLDDIIAKSKKWFKRLHPGAKFLESKGDLKWVFPDGEELLFRQFKKASDYWNYHGHEYPFIAWEELTSWPMDDCYESMKACSRSSHPGMPRFYLSTCNPWGAGHGWVKQYFIDIGPPGTLIMNDEGLPRIRIHGDILENKRLLEADPQYINRLESLSNEQLRQAWRYGDWDIHVGGFLAGIWDAKRHWIKPFNIPLDWPRWRAGDWGFGKPFSIGWYALDPETGCIYRYRELYGWGGKPDVGTRESPQEIAVKIHKMEKHEIDAGIIFRKNPMDTNLWANASGIKIDGKEITPGSLFSEAKVKWTPAKKGKGSRMAGAIIVIQRLKNDTFKVFNTCHHWKRTVTVLQPDEDNWEDVDPEQEAHAWDETRYSLVSRHKAPPKSGKKDEGPLPGTFDWLCKFGNVEQKRSIYRP